jgi:hypothetical protein
MRRQSAFPFIVRLHDLANTLLASTLAVRLELRDCHFVAVPLLVLTRQGGFLHSRVQRDPTG